MFSGLHLRAISKLLIPQVTPSCQLRWAGMDLRFRAGFLVRRFFLPNPSLSHRRSLSANCQTAHERGYHNTAQSSGHKSVTRRAPSVVTVAMLELARVAKYSRATLGSS